MRVLLVSIDLEYSLTYAYLQAFANRDPQIAEHVQFCQLALDPSKLGVYVDKNLESYRLLEQIEDQQPSLVCFSCYLWNHVAVRELIATIRRVYPGVRIVVGGPEVLTREAATAFLVNAPADVVVRGEGEVTFAELCRAELDGSGVEDIAGLTWRAGDAIRHNPDRAVLRDLDAIPSPVLGGYIDLDQFDAVDDAGNLVPGRHRRYILETYRGCYMACAYCQWGDGVPFRARFSLERVIAELDRLIEKRVALVNFVDAMFGFSISTAKQTLRAIIESKRWHGSGTVFIGYHNQDFYDEELFDLYREAGFYPEIDLQSTNGDVLDLLGRGKWRRESYEKHRAAFAAHRVIVHDCSDLIIGLPGDTYASLCRSIDYFLERGIRVNLFHTSALPGTRIWNDAERLGVVFHPEPPRFVVKTATMSVRDVVRARLLGHGTELFQQYPNTMALVRRQVPEFARPSVLCEAFGDWLARRGEVSYEIGQYNRDYRLLTYQDLAQSFLEEISATFPSRTRAVLLEIFRFEAERKRSLQFGQEVRAATAPAPDRLLDQVMRLAHRRRRRVRLDVRENKRVEAGLLQAFNGRRCKPRADHERIGDKKRPLHPQRNKLAKPRGRSGLENDVGGGVEGEFHFSILSVSCHSGAIRKIEPGIQLEDNGALRAAFVFELVPGFRALRGPGMTVVRIS